MTELNNLLLKIRSDAHHLQQVESDVSFRTTCKHICKTIDAMLFLWRKARDSNSVEEECKAGTITNFWCDVLGTSIMSSHLPYLQKCLQEELEQHVVQVSALFFAIAKKHPEAELRAQARDLCESFVACCDALQKGIRVATVQSTALLPAVPDYSQTISESERDNSRPPRRSRFVPVVHKGGRS